MNTEDGVNRVLVIDDELGPRESIRFLLNQTHQVSSADSVDSGIQLLKQQAPDLIIMDIKMPDKDGIQGLREIRAIDPDVSVIMLTGFGTLETAQEAIRLGATDYIQKPFDAKGLRVTVAKYIDATRASRIARKREETFDQLTTINKQLENQLQDKEHLASLGQASSEFVHDLRNPLNVICGYVQLLIDDLKRTESSSRETIDYLEIIARNAQRCQEMSNMWRDVANPRTLRKQPCRAMDIVSDVVESCTPLASEVGASITTKSGPTDCMINANRLHLYRAMQNVVTNALQALTPGGGDVAVGWQASGTEVAFIVEDNGCGIPPDRLATVFSPGHSTKGHTGGMGLGLFITKKVIESHGGTISLENRPAGGVSAVICLPQLPPD